MTETFWEDALEFTDDDCELEPEVTVDVYDRSSLVDAYKEGFDAARNVWGNDLVYSDQNHVMMHIDNLKKIRVLDSDSYADRFEPRGVAVPESIYNTYFKWPWH